MQSQPSAEHPRVSGSVRGLGVCDALRVELQDVQLSPLIDAAAAFVRSCELGLERRAGVSSASGPRALEAQAAAEYELRLAERLREALPRRGHVGPFALVGPAGMAFELVRSCARDATMALALLLGAPLAGDDAATAELERTAAAAAAWTATLLDCRTVEAFRFDPDANPGPPS